MKDSKRLQPAWVPPFFVWSEDSGSCVTIESEEQGAWFLFLPRSCWGDVRGVFLKGSRLRSAEVSADWVWSLIPRHLSWPISDSPTHGFLATFHIFLLPQGPCALPLNWSQMGGGAQEVNAMGT